MTAGWDLREPVDSEDVHIAPTDDVTDHLPKDCPCGPRTEAVQRADGSMGWLVVHSSLDGRELREPDYQGQVPPEG